MEAILLVGVNQQTAPVALRERLALPPATLPDTLAALGRLTAEGLLLSTCNRVEVYAVSQAAPAGIERLVAFLAAGRELAPATLRPHLYIHQDAAAVRHLFAVAAGLDSMVVGEDQILAQVKGALAVAQAAGTLGPVLHRLGAAALAASKQVRSQTAIGRSHLSVVSVALQLAAARLGGLDRQAVLIIGAGKTAELLLKHLAGRPPRRLTVINRTHARAAALAARYGAAARPWGDLPAALAEADLVVGCTGAPHAVLDRATVTAVLATRPARPLLALDLAVPRDIDRAVADLPGLAVYDVDGLQACAAANRELRAGEIAQAAALIAQAVEAFLAWWRGRAGVPTIAALRAHTEAIRDAEVARILARLPGLPAGQEAALRYLAEALVNKLLHAPSVALKTHPDAAHLAAAAHELFGLAAPPAIPQPEESIAPYGS